LGEKAEPGQVSPVKAWLGVFALISQVAWGSVPPNDIGVVSNYELSHERLTTEKVGTLDPSEINPHRRMWILQRAVDFKGLEAVKKGGRFGARADGLEVDARGWVRGSGPWFQTLEEFPCSETPVPDFATIEGSQRAAEAGARTWISVLSDSRDALRIQLSHISEESSEAALVEAKQVLAEWLARSNRDWREDGRKEAREVEWAYYLETARAHDLCTGKKPRAFQPPPWRDRMESVSAGAAPVKVLARAPARRWNGLYSVRLTVRVGATNSLSGQFLIDTSAPRTIFNPEWLQGQGVLPAWIEIPRMAPERASFTAGRGLGRRASVDSVEFAGYALPLPEVLLFATEIFTPPENLATCCDGVLGMDALRNLVVEFRAGPPAEVVLWPKEGFHAPYGDSSVWFEASLTPGWAPQSETCAARPQRTAALPGVGWDTGSQLDLEAEPAWFSHVRQSKGPWDIVCDGMPIGTGVYPDVQKPAEAEGVRQDQPSVRVGMPLLGRSSFTLDLPHGRIWFPKASLAQPVRQNRTGLTLIFDYSEGERVLRVARLRANSLLRPLVQAGLHPGSQILEVDSKPADEADLWEIDQRLGGAYGPSVELKWKSATGKVRTMKLPVKGKG
jgi:hypothetical protein